MAVPFRRTSKMKKRSRRTHFKLGAPGTQKCPSCGEVKKMHRVCPHCGTYKDKSIFTAEE